MVNSMDQGIGKIIATLEKHKLRENTIVFFLSDNGGVYSREGFSNQSWADNTPLKEGKGSMCEGGIHVPFFMSWPAQIKAGATYKNPVISLDIAATSIAAASKEVSISKYDGVNLLPYLTGKKAEAPHKALFWREGNSFAWAIRTPSGKYLKNGWKHDKETHYYEINNDLSETSDLKLANKEKCKELVTLWNEWNAKNIPRQVMQAGEYQKARRAMFKKLHEDFRKKQPKKLLQIEIDR